MYHKDPSKFSKSFGKWIPTYWKLSWSANWFLLDSKITHTPLKFRIYTTPPDEQECKSIWLIFYLILPNVSNKDKGFENIFHVVDSLVFGLKPHRRHWKTILGAQTPKWHCILVKSACRYVYQKIQLKHGMEIIIILYGLWAISKKD